MIIGEVTENFAKALNHHWELHCAAVEGRLHDAEEKGAPGGRWGGGAAAGNRVRTVEAAKQFGKIGGFHFILKAPFFLSFFSFFFCIQTEK